MSVAVNGATRHTWPVSTGRAPFGTPNGTFTPQRMARSWFSRKYYNSPMPHSIFYYKGYAIHGTTHISRLGGTASHGCVRLHPENAATLFALVQSHGARNTKIVVTSSGGIRAKSRRVQSEAPAPRQVFFARYGAAHLALLVRSRTIEKRIDEQIAKFYSLVAHPRLLRHVRAAFRADAERAAAGRAVRPPCRRAFRLCGRGAMRRLPRPGAALLAAVVLLFTVAQARRSASPCETPRHS